MDLTEAAVRITEAIIEKSTVIGITGELSTPTDVPRATDYGQIYGQLYDSIYKAVFDAYSYRGNTE